ncbi:MAG: hypothetical protein KIT83_01945 [Bryobacterales bacterium]|nr:hypothetical protein [Bryobacterales bacterium]
MQCTGVVFRTLFITIAVAVATASARGQVRPITGEFPLSSAAAKADAVPAGEEAFEIPIVLDPNPSGKDFIHIFRDQPAAAISVRTPTGTVLTAATAATHGFNWQEANIQVDSVAMEDDSDGFGPDVTAEGAHTLLMFPPSQAAGTYVIVVDSRSVTEVTSLQITAHLDSPIAVTTSSDASDYRLGDPVTVAAVVFENGQSVVNVTATATVVGYRYVTGDVTVGGFSLESKTDLGNGLSRYAYKVSLTNNTGNSQWRFVATADTFDDEVRIIRGSLGFEPISGSMPVESEETILVLAPTSPNYNPSALEWEVTAFSAPVELSLVDVGPGNDLTADGVFTARFVPTESGLFEIGTTIQGTSPSGKPFYRVASSGFSVHPAQATVASITSVGIDANNNQKYEALRFTATIDVQEPGDYTLSFQIRDTAEHTHTFLRAAELNAGGNQIVQEVDAKHLLEAGFTSGPLSIVGVTLRREVFGRDTVVDYHETMGITPSYDLGDFERGSIYFTGQASEQALNLDGQPGYDVLRVQAVAMQGPGVSSGPMNCRVQGRLTDAAGSVIDAVTAPATMREGSNQVVIDFRGPKIARSNVNGPYAVRNVSLECSGMRDTATALLTTTGYLAADFQNIQPEFHIDLSGISLKPGQTRTVPVTVRGIGAYEGTVTMSAPSASPGLSPVVSYPEVLVDALTTVKLTAGAGITPGTYSMDLSATDGTITRTRTIPVVVSDEDVAVQIVQTGPAFLHPGMSTQLEASVLHAAEQGVTWSAHPGAGLITANGASATYTVGAVPAGNSEIVLAASAADPTRVGRVSLVVLPPVLIHLDPVTTTLRDGESTWIYASLENHGNTYNPSLTWTSEGPTGSMLKYSLQARYTAPATITSPQTVAIRATFAEDPAALAEVVLTLVPTIQVSVAPSTATVRPNDTQQFTATVTNDPTNAGVTWQVTPQVGSVDASGTYTAPAMIAAQSTVTLRATSVSDPSRSATASITLLPPLDPRMTLTAPLSDISVPAGSVRDVAFTLTPVDGFVGEATLSVDGLAAGATAQFLPGATSDGGTSLLRLGTETGLAEGNYPITLRAALPDRVVTLPLQLSVIAAPPFTVVTGNPVGAVPANSSVTFTIDVSYRAGWTGIVVPSAAGLPIGATVSFAPASRSVPGIFLATVKPATGASLPLHAVEVVVKHLQTPTTLRSTHVLLMPDSEGLPEPWAHTGVAATPQGVRHQSGVFTMESAGAGIDVTTDAFQFVHRPTSGDFTLVARVGGGQAAVAESKVGLMVRDGFSGNERIMFLGWDSTGNVVRVYRRGAGDRAQSTNIQSYAKPYWLKLVRSVNTFRSFVSADGQ